MPAITTLKPATKTATTTRKPAPKVESKTAVDLNSPKKVERLTDLLEEVRLSQLIGCRFNMVEPAHIDNLDGISIVNTETGRGFFIGVKQQNDQGETACIKYKLTRVYQEHVENVDFGSVRNRELVMKSVDRCVISIADNETLTFTFDFPDTAMVEAGSERHVHRFELSIGVVNSSGNPIVPSTNNLTLYVLNDVLSAAIDSANSSALVR